MLKKWSKLLVIVCAVSLLVTMPSITVLAEEGLVGQLGGFSDVQNPSHPYYKAIYWAADAGITKGYSDGTFGINRSCTRGEMMMFLWRFAKKPKPKEVKKIPFKDVPKTHTFYKAILWGYQEGITKGYSDGTFGINRNVSRGEMMMFLWRVEGKPTPTAVSKSPFKDVLKSHVFYKAILWGAQKGITKGYTTGAKKGLFGINDNCTRGQIVTFIYRINPKQEEPTDPNLPVDEHLVDTDKDGIADIDEKSYGTDPNKRDTDGDELTDFEEILLGTDPLVPNESDKSSDTDEDGLTDYDEATNYHTDPYAADTDGDGLTDFDEVSAYHTDPANFDTDGDSLSDGFELAHGLDPNSRCSDGVTSDSSIRILQDLPETAISSSLISIENLAKPSLYGEATGELSNNIYMSTAVDTAAEDNRAIIGKPIFIEGKDDYVSGLTLSFDLSSYESATSSLIVVTLDEEGNYIPLDSSLSGNTLSVNIDKCGTYFVLDIDEFLASLGINYEAETEILTGSGDGLDFDEEDENTSANAIIVDKKAEAEKETFEENTDYEDISISDDEDDVKIEMAEVPEVEEVTEYAAEVDEFLLDSLNAANEELVSSSVSGQADIVFAIDTTGSMSSAINNVVTNVTSFATTLSDNYNVKVNYALIDFKDLEEDGPGTTIVVKNGSSNWYSDAKTFTKKVQGLVATGGGDTPECDIDALETARRLDWRTNSNKFIILITDTYFKTINDYGIGSMAEEINLLARDGINTSVVTTTSNQSTYQSLYEATGGIFANISSSSFSSSLLALADLIGETTSDGTWVILKHGYRYVKLTDEADQDNDGLSTAYELGNTEEVDLSSLIVAQMALHGVPIENYLGKTSITVYKAKSDPTKEDTDNDGILDDKDNAPWTKGKANGIIGKLALVSCYGDGWSDGHSFFAYQSYVTDSIDFSGLANGWHRIDRNKNWTAENIKRDYTPTSAYSIMPDEYVCIGNGALGAGPSNSGNTSGTVDGLGEGSIGDANGVNYNMETAKFIGHGRPTGAGVPCSYLSNTYITEEITDATLKKLISYLGQDDVNYWGLMHNCAKVAADGWNHISGTKVSAKGVDGWGIAATPSALKDSLRKINGHAEDWQMSEAFK